MPPLDTNGLALIIADCVKAATAPLLARIAALEQRPIVIGRDGVNGRDGLMGEKGLTGERGLIGPIGAIGPEGPAGASVQGPVGERGEKGERGEQGTPGMTGPPGITGADGASGRDGKDAEPWTQAQVIDALKAMPEAFTAAATVYFAAHPVANGKDGAAGIAGKDGAPGFNGKNGIGLAGAILTREGHLAFTLSDGTVRELGPVVGKDGTDGVNGKDGTNGLNGKDVDLADVRRQVLEEVAKIPIPKDGTNGKDGFGFDDLSVRQDETGWYLCFVQGNSRKEFPLPYLADRGVWKAATVYQAGHFVTWNGSLWIAKQETTDRPGNGATGWRLAVKSGAEGKQGPKGDPGHDGRDLTQMDTTGRKW